MLLALDTESAGTYCVTIYDIDSSCHPGRTMLKSCYYLFQERPSMLSVKSATSNQCGMIDILESESLVSFDAGAIFLPT